MRKGLKYYTVSLLLLVTITLPVDAQNNTTDSLRTLLKRSKRQAIHDTTKIILLGDLAAEMMYNNPDTAILLGKQALKLAIAIKWKKGTSDGLGNLGVFNYMKGNYDQALGYYTKALHRYEKSNNRQEVSTMLSNIGIIYRAQGNYPMALDIYFRALKIAEKMNDTINIAGSIGNIGNVYQNLGELGKSLVYLKRALKIEKVLNDRYRIALVLTNMGVVYRDQGNNEKALACYYEALKENEILKRNYGVSANHCNIGMIYFRQKKYTEALEHYNIALELDRELNDKNGMTANLSNIGSLYIEMAGEISSLKLKRAMLYKAEKYLLDGLLLANSMKAIMYIEAIEKFLSSLYEQKGMPALALQHYQKYITARDHVFNEENTKKSIQAEMNFEFEKKQAAEKVEHEKRKAVALAKQEEEQRQQNIILLFISGGLLMVLVFAVFVFRVYRQHGRDTVLITRQKQEMEKQKLLVEYKQKELLDSIYYARRIQRALLPSKKYIERTLKK